MAQSADYISFDSEIPSPEVEDDMVAPSCGKIHEAIEVGDDYNSEEDPTSSPATAEGVQDLSDRAALHSNSKRPAESQSLGSNLPEDAKRQKLRAAPKEKSLALLLPDKFWVDIFSQLHPHTLGQVRRTCQLFYKHLQNEVIWKTSRKRFMPEMPKPVFNLKEWEMLALAKGEGCMLCNAKLPTRSVYWAFRIRCCSQCLQKNTTKVSP